MVLATAATPSLSKDKQEYCETLAQKIKTISDLPAVCQQYDSVQAMIQKRRTIVDPFAGMQGGTAARAKRAGGVESHAKIQRRLTTGATTGTRRFSKLDK